MDKNNVSVTKNYYRDLNFNKIDKTIFLPVESEEDYNASGKSNVEDLIYKLYNFYIENLNCVVDYGCGDGRMAQFMSEQCKKLICVDVNETILNLAKKRLSNKNNISFIIDKDFNLDNSVDFIYCFQVIQHNPYEEQIEIINKIYKALRKNGVACIHFPKIENHPEYKNNNFCMRFSYEQIENLVKNIFHCNYNITIFEPREKSFEIIRKGLKEKIKDDFPYNDYLLWIKK